MTKKTNPLLLSIGGGKGGVGKSMVSSNLAIQFAQGGLRVALLDLDFGAANLHTIFGLRYPQHGLGDYFSQKKSELKNFLIETPVNNLWLAPGSGFIPELADLKYEDKIKLINHIKELDADIVLLDLGAGTSSNVVDFFSMTTAGIVVTTPEPTSIVNAYEFLKNIVYRALFRMFKKHPELLKIVKQSSTNENSQEGNTPVIKTIEEIIKKIEKKYPWAAENISDLCKDFNFHLVFNQARDLGEVQLGRKLHDISKKYLNLNLGYSGILFYNEQVAASVHKMSPISLTEPESTTTKSLKKIASHTLKKAIQKHRGEEILPFDDQYQHVLMNAQKDYQQYLLNRKSARL